MSTRARKDRKRARQEHLADAAEIEREGYPAPLTREAAEELRFRKPAKVGTPVQLRARYRDPLQDAAVNVSRGLRLARLLGGAR